MHITGNKLTWYLVWINQALKMANMLLLMSFCKVLYRYDREYT